jgi:hypothetical protein
MDIKQINSAIMFGTFTNTELDSIMSAVQYARAQIRAVKIRTFTRGDTVKFHSTKRGVTVTGTVTKVAIKYVTVKDGVTLWKVPANMLEAA